MITDIDRRLSNPANTRGPPDNNVPGTYPGDGFAAGQWTVVNGALVLIPAPAGFWFPPKDGHP
jgi:hypothetical protein